MKNAKLRKILRVSDKEREIVEDRLIEQIEIEININGKLVKRIATAEFFISSSVVLNGS